MFYRFIIFLLAVQFCALSSCTQSVQPVMVDYNDIVTGAKNLITTKLEMIKGKKVGIVANQASLVNNTHLVDTLLKHGIEVVKIFSPEHGFRGNMEAGALVNDGIDEKTGLQIVSLYGSHKKPSKSDLLGIEILLFDLQDVGVRFYTYISAMAYLMEACAENNIPFIVLDRPNPNGFYVDGPVLNPEYSSFIGMHTVPIVYGMTIGEYAIMVNEEGWLKNGVKCDLTILKLGNYRHNMLFKLPVKPSPNLPNWQSVYLYPSICLFEGTIMSEGRGTDFPFQVYGHPDFHIGNFTFTPERIPGVSENPKYKSVRCNGQNLAGYASNYQNLEQHFNIDWLIESYNYMSPDHEFFTAYFELLAGTRELREQIEAGLSEEEIRKSWQEELESFELIRKKYLLYD